MAEEGVPPLLYEVANVRKLRAPGNYFVLNFVKPLDVEYPTLTPHVEDTSHLV